MIIREVNKSERVQYNHIVTHPLQSWQWGEFRERTGVEVVRLGAYQQNRLVNAYQLTIHQLPKVSYTIGYLPKCPIPDETIIAVLKDLGKEYNCIFIKLEPNVEKLNHELQFTNRGLKIGEYILHKSPHNLFPKYTFQIDLAKTEDELLGQMNHKTRYNVRLAKRKGVIVEEDNSDEAFNTYLKLMFETTKRQKFYAHDERYHRLMWKTLGHGRGILPNAPTPIAHLLTAKYQGKILVAWIIFLFNGILYYPYGASSNAYRQMMASNLMMWEVMLWGKKHGAKVFDLWGSLGSNPDKNDPWYGFHRFKAGYGPRLVEFVGSWDLVLNSLMYRLYNVVHKIRWLLLQRMSL